MPNRYDKIQEKVAKRGELLEEVYAALETFLTSVVYFDEWYTQVADVLEASDKLEVEQLAAKIEEIAEQRDSRREDFEETIKSGKALVVKKDISDATPIRDKIKGLEMQWKDLNAVIDNSLKEGRARLDQLNAYEKLREQVLEWLTRNEKRVDALEPVAVDADIIKKQIDEVKVRPCWPRSSRLSASVDIWTQQEFLYDSLIATDFLQPMLKEYRDYESTINRVGDLGANYETGTRPRPESSPKRPSLSATKRPSIGGCKRVGLFLVVFSCFSCF